MNITDNQTARFGRRYSECATCISRLIQHLSIQLASASSRDECLRKDQRGEELFMQMKVLELLQLSFRRHTNMQRVSLECYRELQGMKVMRGVFSPEFATDSYLWARHIAQKRLVNKKSVLEMGAGSGVISLYLYRKANPDSICAVDVNKYAVENLRDNVDFLGIDKARFEVVESDLFEGVPLASRFDVILWAMPWIFSEEQCIRQVVDECGDPVEQALLRSVIDPGGASVLTFISEAKRRLNLHGKVLLISADFIPNDKIRYHAESEGFLFEDTVFEKNVTVVEATGMTLNLHHLELTLI